MKEVTPYNPLALENLGASVESAILQRDPEPLPPDEVFIGAGLYAIYFLGDFPPYSAIAAKNRRKRFDAPIYVGKAVPAGKRKGTITTGEYKGRALFDRLSEHSKSIEQAANLEVSDFRCRYLVVADIWIPLGESLLIQRYSPLWNTVVDGFGNHDPGSGRYNQKRSSWDVLHPGRSWAERLKDSKKTEAEILQELKQAEIRR